ncbi:unnamed protein product [Heterobilharzia americana]|nr:unnamed protein product [Heterobilharzia americana]CAH8518178.1 unnamed protein product [Heterobilharzia americana]
MYTSPTYSSVSTELSECYSSPNRPRKKYECVPESLKTAPDYIDQRIRNRNAVKRFRERSKTKAKKLEEEKANLISLTQLYDNELIRIKRSKQKLELLLYQHAAHKNITNQLDEILRTDAKARSDFQSKLANIQASSDSSLMDIIDERAFAKI